MSILKLIFRRNMEKDKLIPAENIPEYLPVKMPTIRSWIMQNKLPVIRLGRRVFIKRNVIERILDEGLSSVSNGEEIQTAL
jgi:excisionase family DNA binding protein|tara:strand:+ start:836 stop:1078 length:243 start_codon:yes stop_codon:yes gene_type:complete